MYLVELRPGKEELYRTTEELAAAIRKGDVDAHSRIYHRATSKWISVTLHPQFKAIVAERVAPPLPPMERTNWTFFNDSSATLEAAPEASEDSDEGKAGGDSNHPWRRPLALSITGGLLILGLQLAASAPKPPWAGRQVKLAPAGMTAPIEMPTLPAAMPGAPQPSAAAPSSSPTISLVTSGSSWNGADRGYAPSGSSSEGATPAPRPVPAAPAVKPAGETLLPTAKPAPETLPPTAKPAPGTLLPAAPRIRPKSLLKAVAVAPQPVAPAPSPAAPAVVPTAAAPATMESPGTAVRSFVTRWTAAHDSALARLESGVRVARLNQLNAPTRLSPGGGVTETRMSIAGVANFVRIYRLQQAAIERQYQDAFTTTSKARGWTPADVRLWYTRSARTDSPSLAALTTSLIDGIDSLLGVLDAQAGTYAITRNTIRFEDPAAAREYTTLRERILATMDSARVAGGTDHPGPMSYLLEAIGTTRLPIAS
jgi:hypothetical protein